jgi:hypothetical protein
MLQYNTGIPNVAFANETRIILCSWQLTTLASSKYQMWAAALWASRVNLGNMIKTLFLFYQNLYYSFVILTKLPYFHPKF